MHSRPTTRILFHSVALAAIAAAAPANAATDNAAATAASADGAEDPVDEIVVTADRRGFGAALVQVGTFRGARLIDVPLTVNVVPQELLKAQAATGLFEALRNTAGVSRSQLNGATYDNVAIRGILVENRTSYRLNGSLPVINLVDLPLENKERVEVLKGVGALYYGFAPPSGIVNLVTKRPVASDLSVLQAFATDRGATNVHADISRRVGPVGVRLNAAAGLVETGIRRFDGARQIVSVAADWQATDRLSFRLDAEHVHKDVTEPAAIQLLPTSGGAIALPPIPSPRDNLGDEELRYDAYATNLLARADLKLSDALAITVEGGQAVTERDRDFSQLEAYDLTTGEGRLRVFQTRGQRFRNRNARAEAAASFSTGPVAHALIAGVTGNWRFQNGRANRTTLVAQNLFAPREIALPTLDAATLTTSPLNIRDLGAYVVNRATVGPVQVLAGLRYSDYRSRARSATGVETRFELDKWTPSVGLLLKPQRDLTLYATYLEGLEEGGTAPANTANANDVLAPAISRQYEAGFKGEIGRSLVFQVAAFQVTRPSAFTDPADNRFKLAGRARYRGVEGSVTGELTPQLSLYASGQYLDAETRRAVNPLLEGRRPENTPEFTGSLFAEYRPAALRGLAVGAGAFYVGDRAVNNFNQAFVDGYTTYSASLRYEFDVGLEVQLNADNLTGKRYYSAAGNGLLGVGLPRQVKLTVRHGF
ncbi:MAG TPA: TonB-dependent siderophore receptor [Sphingomonadaceae bacterium]|nr:TonB-dependent siderophore receptor [Sphingomonadaceae bacterium]